MPKLKKKRKHRGGSTAASQAGISDSSELSSLLTTQPAAVAKARGRQPQPAPLLPRARTSQAAPRAATRASRAPRRSWAPTGWRPRSASPRRRRAPTSSSSCRTPWRRRAFGWWTCSARWRRGAAAGAAARTAASWPWRRPSSCAWCRGSCPTPRPASCATCCCCSPRARAVPRAAARGQVAQRQAAQPTASRPRCAPSPCGRCVWTQAAAVPTRDRRNGGCLVPPGRGAQITYKELSTALKAANKSEPCLRSLVCCCSGSHVRRWACPLNGCAMVAPCSPPRSEHGRALGARPGPQPAAAAPGPHVHHQGAPCPTTTPRPHRPRATCPPLIAATGRGARPPSTSASPALCSPCRT